MGRHWAKATANQMIGRPEPDCALALRECCCLRFGVSVRVIAPLPVAMEARPEHICSFLLLPIWGTHSKLRNKWWSLFVSFYKMWLWRSMFLNRNFQICRLPFWKGRILFYSSAIVTQNILKLFFFWTRLRDKLQAAVETKSACFVVLPHFWLKTVLVCETPSPWPLPMALGGWLFPDLLTVLRGSAFASAELNIVGNDHQLGASGSISLEGTKIIISLHKLW